MLHCFKMGDEVSVRLLKRVVLIESVLLVICFLALSLFISYESNDSKRETEVYRQSSNDGDNHLVIYEIGEPVWSFGRAHYKVLGPSDFSVDVADDGGHGWFEVEWKENAVVVTFGGSEQLDEVYILPFS